MQRSDKIAARIMAILEMEPASVQDEVLIKVSNEIRKERERQLDLANLSVSRAKKILLDTPVLDKIDKYEADAEAEEPI